MPECSADDCRAGTCSVYLGIDETRVAYLAAHGAEEAGVRLCAVGREVADDVSFAVEVNPIAAAVIAGVEWFPVEALHIDICSQHEVNHLVLNEHVVHVVELLGAQDDVGVVLAAVACLVGVCHVVTCGLQTLDESFHLFILEGAVGYRLLCLGQCVICFLSAVACGFRNGKLFLQEVGLDDKVGINVDAGLYAVDGAVNLEQLLVAGGDFVCAFCCCFVGGDGLVVARIIWFSGVSHAFCHFVIAGEHGCEDFGVGVGKAVTINDIDLAYAEALCFGEGLLGAHSEGQPAARGEAIDALAELAIEEVVGDDGIGCRGVDAFVGRTKHGGGDFPDVVFHAVFCVEAVHLQFVESIHDVGADGLRDVEGAAVACIAEGGEGGSLAAARLAVVAGGDVPAFPGAFHQVGILDFVGEVCTVAGIEDGCIALVAAGMSVVDDGPVALPRYLVEKHEATVEVVVGVVAMVEEPGLPFVVGDDFAVVSGSFPSVVAGDDGGVVVAHHLSALLVEVRPHEFLRAAHDGAVGAFLSFAAGADAAEEIVVLAALVYHGSLEGSAGQLRDSGMPLP